MCRFISADTIVPEKYAPRTLNRYSYCANNPVKYTDPSGHFWGLTLQVFWEGAIIGAGIAGTAAKWSVGNKAQVQQAMLNGAVSGAISAGCFNAAGNMIDPINTPISVKTMIHSAAGIISNGLSAAITGGSSREIGKAAFVGGLSAGLGKHYNIDSYAGRIAVGAVSGGVASDWAGGSFSQGAFQGAWTGWMAYHFNDNGEHKIEGPEIGDDKGFKNIDKAATNAIDKARLSSKISNREFGGFIYEDGEKYSYTRSVAGTEDSILVSTFNKPPDGQKIVGIYHTHLGDGYAAKVFSSLDYLQAGRYDKIYLGTQSGFVKGWDHSDRKSWIVREGY